jgi:hypothetical protein
MIALAALGVIGTAKADVIVGTYSGTLAAGTTDTYGVFSQAGANLSGMSFSGGFSIDTDETGATTSCLTGTVCDRTMGASRSSVVSLTIDGTTFAVHGNFEAAALAAQDTGTHLSTYQIAAQNNLSGNTLFGNFTDPAMPGDPTTMLESITMSGGALNDLFRIITDGADLEQFNVASYTLTVSDQSVTVVPEPPAWLALIGGLALLVPLAGRRARLAVRAA